MNFHSVLPKFFTCLTNGYTKETVLKDLFSGISIGIISLPLIMGFAIAAGLPPERGLFAGVIGGFLISLLGGSRVQIGGPTGAFVIVVYSIVEKHGYEGLIIATLMAGIIMLFLAFSNAGALLKYIPYPVAIGFTAGIAFSLFSSQIKDLFGFPIEKLPANFLQKWSLYFEHFNTASWNLSALAMGMAAIVFIFLLRKKYPKAPGSVIAVTFGTAIAYYFELPIETIQSKFGGIPNRLPAPIIPDITFQKIQTLFPDAITIAFLSSIESLLSAVMADKMTGFRHRSSSELFAHGIANIFSSFFGGIPVTGAIARTAANVRFGAKTPLSGITHAVTLFILMTFFSTQAAHIPLALLAAVLIFIAWNMSEQKHIAMICKGSKSDILMLFTTMIITILIDITVAVEVGVILAALLFMYKMTRNTHIAPYTKYETPEGVLAYEVKGPLFFGIAENLQKEFHAIATKPQTFIFSVKKASLIDASGIHALQELANTCKTHGIDFLISGLSDDNKTLLKKMGLTAPLFTTFHEALSKVAASLENNKNSP